MKTARSLKWLLAVVGAMAIAWAVWQAVQWDRIDRCLDRGGSWHYDREVCDFEVNYEGPRP